MAGRGSYPHPVIDPADDVSSDFEVFNPQMDPTQQDIAISYEIRTDDPDLKNLLERGDAIHSLRWRCSATISTGDMNPSEEKRTSTGFKISASLDQQEVRGRVEADIRIVAAKTILAHRWTRQHSDYGDATFDLQRGDVLADGGSISFDADKKYDPLDPPVGSCFRFVRSTSSHKRISVSFDSDETIDVKIPAKTFDEFHQFSNRPDIQISLIVLPALMDTIRFIKASSKDESLDYKVWYTAIDTLVNEHGGWDKTPLELAQKILENPLDTAIRKGLMTSEEEG